MAENFVQFVAFANHSIFTLKKLSIEVPACIIAFENNVAVK